MTAAEHLQGLLSRPQEHQIPSFEDIATTDSSQTGNVPTDPANQFQSDDESDQQDDKMDASVETAATGTATATEAVASGPSVELTEFGDEYGGSSDSFPYGGSITLMEPSESVGSSGFVESSLPMTFALAASRKRQQGRLPDQYAPHLTHWDEYWKSHAIDNVMEPYKAVKFLKEEIFIRTKAVTIKTDLGYDGIVGRTKHDPEENPSAAQAEADELRTKFVEDH
ncbi:hypothetical protein BGX20_000638 [Mortierella sp. AD010]|nr:hypothetical protein BGX20_000638 [Mortierella sp. AD010]